MANIRDKVGEQSQPTGGGMRRVLADGSESVTELREFMGQMRGRSPQEVLGAVANSGLVRSTLVAALGFIIVLFGLSVAVHYWKGPQEKDKTAATPAATPDKKQPDSSPKQSPAESATQAAAANPGADSTQQSGDQTLDNLGIGETKQTDPKKNPLEDSLDNLLDGTK
jgi:preprotein translocase subunit SecG